MESVQQIANQFQKPPTKWKTIQATVTSAVAEQVSEFEFGLDDGVMSSGILFVNDGTDTIQLSLDGGETYFPVAVGTERSADFAGRSVHVKSSSASQAFTLVVGGVF